MASPAKPARCAGINRALIEHDAALKPALKKAGLVTRDRARVERKKVGLHKARKRHQFSKRSNPNPPQTKTKPSKLFLRPGGKPARNIRSQAACGQLCRLWSGTVRIRLKGPDSRHG